MPQATARCRPRQEQEKRKHPPASPSSGSTRRGRSDHRSEAGPSRRQAPDPGNRRNRPDSKTGSTLRETVPRVNGKGSRTRLPAAKGREGEGRGGRKDRKDRESGKQGKRKARQPSRYQISAATGRGTDGTEKRRHRKRGPRTSTEGMRQKGGRNDAPPPSGFNSNKRLHYKAWQTGNKRITEWTHVSSGSSGATT